MPLKENKNQMDDLKNTPDNHVREHKCRMCEKSFRLKRDLNRHTKGVHSFKESKKYKCEQCPSSYGQKVHLKIHSKRKHSEVIHESPREYACHLCPQTYDQKIQLKIHIKDVHIESLDTQVEIETNKDFEETYLNCDECQNSFATGYDLRVHQESEHSKEGKYECRISSSSFHQIADLTKHVEDNHQNHDLSTTEKELQIETGERNVEMQNKIQIFEKVVEHKLTRYKCKQCNKSFKRAQAAKNHFDIIHNFIRKYKCELCSKQFGYKNVLKIHILTMHREGENKKYKCEQCNMVHDGEKCYKCNQCGNSFSKIGSLNRHKMTVHDGIKRFQCEQCEAAYTDKRVLMNHCLKLHNNQSKLRVYSPAQYSQVLCQYL